jgi:hypothetical protein
MISPELLGRNFLCRQMWDGCSDISVRLQAHRQSGRFRVNGLWQTKHCGSVPVGAKRQHSDLPGSVFKFYKSGSVIYKSGSGI